jgi:succinoglycan biosynthesis protein ExoO
MSASVSVVIPVFNSGPLLGRAVASVIAQTQSALEIIIVDDASTDSTWEFASELAAKHPEIVLIKLENNGGPSKARNVAIEAARGEWIAILDADDAWKPRRIEALTELGNETGADYVADNQVYYDAALETESKIGFVPRWPYKKISLEDVFENDLIGVSEFTYSVLKPFIRKSFLKSKNIKYDENLRCGEDFVMTCEVLINGGVSVLTSEPLYIYTTRTGTLSGKSSPHSKTVHKFDVVIRASQEFMERHRGEVGPRLWAAHKRRQKQLLRLHLANQAREIRRDGRYGAYALFVASQPELVSWLVRSNYSKIAAKFSTG